MQGPKGKEDQMKQSDYTDGDFNMRARFYEQSITGYNKSRERNNQHPVGDEKPRKNAKRKNESAKRLVG